ncbi:hypothetical protein [Methylocapsa sp. S129]|uniref:hypothetical protein n=1 Tax=Methylocapsa sp. S129 TaxID=1641869 RepID=UPI00131A7EAF|nr:hypothetical protein [Methylocapsa sp. S129]
MRKIILLATTTVALAIGASAAYATSPNLTPEQSPYAILAPQTLASPSISEGRAAFTGDNAGYSSSYVDPAPQTVTPEERNYYSRGR